MDVFLYFFSRELLDPRVYYGLHHPARDLILTEHKKLKEANGIVVAKMGAVRNYDFAGD